MQVAVASSRRDNVGTSRNIFPRLCYGYLILPIKVNLLMTEIFSFLSITSNPRLTKSAARLGL